MIAAVTRANIQILEQASVLLPALGGGNYATRVAACYNATPGGHMRHVLDHYLSLFEGLDAGEVDYERRARDGRIESDVAYATQLLRGVIVRLDLLAGDGRDRALRVRSETVCAASADSAPVWCASSLVRELEFLLSHTVHHYALIATMCRLLGHEPAPDFGMAPSTLRHVSSHGSTGG